MKIAVVDGQGGGIGKSLIEKLRAALGKTVYIIALGTNSLATSSMLKAGADDGATGENALIVNVRDADIIAGSLGIIAADTMLGELTPAMALAVSSSAAQKVLIPLNRCKLYVAGVKSQSLPHHIDGAVAIIKDLMDKQLK